MTNAMQHNLFVFNFFVYRKITFSVYWEVGHFVWSGDLQLDIGSSRWKIQTWQDIEIEDYDETLTVMIKIAIIVACQFSNRSIMVNIVITRINKPIKFQLAPNDLRVGKINSSIIKFRLI